MSAPALTICAVGDIMLGDLPACTGFGVGSMIAKHGAQYPFAPCRELLQGADLTIGNLEVACSAFNAARDPFDACHLRAQPEVLEGLAWAGIGAVSLANNHIMQHGRQAVLDTVSHLRTHGVTFTGLEDESAGLDNLTVLERNGTSIALLGYNFRPDQYRRAQRMDVAGEPQRILADIAGARSRADLVIVSVHWGEEFVCRPSAEQVRQAREMVDGGAHIVLGHHPHILQGVERYKGAVIAYSLGNFIFDLWPTRLRESMILRLTVENPSDIRFEAVPVLINDRWQPEPLDGEARNLAVREIERRSLMIDPALDQDEWRREVQGELERFRRGVRSHYLRSIYRYDLRKFAANLFGVLSRRIGRTRADLVPSSGGS